ncbi:sphingolipid long chain base-responsive protein Pil1p [Monosporozyma unispora]|nr:Eisosome core component [Kazachstania unispora]
MHKTYSLRNARVPTQSQLQNPPPPPATTKGKFFGGKGGLAFNFRKNYAGAMGPQLARKLAQLVKIEKNVLRAMEIASMERRQAAQQLSLWGLENDDDVSDITDKLGVLIYEMSELDDQFIDRYDQYRLTLKSIRDIENSIQGSRDRKEKIDDKIAYLKYKDPNNIQKIEILEQELVRAEAESLVAEAQLSNITRSKMKAAFSYQFDSMIEHSEKVALIAGYGKALLELLDDSPVTPGETRPAYDGYEASKQIIIDAEHALNEWTLDTAQVRPNLSIREYQEETDSSDEDLDNRRINNQTVQENEWIDDEDDDSRIIEQDDDDQEVQNVANNIEQSL